MPCGYAIDVVRVPVAEFRIPPLELEDMLPQQQLMLQAAAAALDDAGCPRTLGDRTGVFVGISLDPNTTNFHCRWAIEEFADEWAQQLGLTLSPAEKTKWIAQLRDAFGPPLTANRVMGNLGGIVASRLAREFDVGGPCFTISSDETSGLHALQTAVRALQLGELDRALVGAVDLPSDLRQLLTRSRGASPARTPLFGDAAIACVLKRLSDAERDGDRIYAVIRDPKPGLSESRASRSDDESNRLPKSSETSEVSMDAELPAVRLPKSRKTSEVLHGESADREARHSERPGFVETVTTEDVIADFGHCGAASGLAAVLKGALALHHQLRPSMDRTAHATPEFWLRDRSGGPRQLEVTGETTDGRPVAVLLEESATIPARVQIERRQPLGEWPLALFVLDGASVDEIRRVAEQLAASLTETQSLESQASTWFQQRPPCAQRNLAACVVAKNAGELRHRLEQVSGTLGSVPDTDGGVFFTATPLLPAGKLAFVFPGSGNHFLGMGRELLAAWPEVLRVQDAENERLGSQFRPELIWNGPSTEAIGRDHKAMIFGQVALGTALCDWLALFGVRPQVSIGYSLGESAALFGLRAWTDRDEMLRRMEASPLFGSDLVRPFDAARQAWKIPPHEAVPWLSGVVDRQAGAVRALLKQFRDVHLLIVNTPQQCVIGGRSEQVTALVNKLEANFVPFPSPSTVHCDILKEVAAAYIALHRMPTTAPAGITFYSSATGQPYELNSESAAQAILAQATATVDFPRVIENAYRDGVRVFVEIGPGSSCTKMIGEILGDRPHVVRALCPATADPVSHALMVLAELIAQRVPVDLAALYGHPKSSETSDVSPDDKLTPFRLPKSGKTSEVLHATSADREPRFLTETSEVPEDFGSLPEREARLSEKPGFGARVIITPVAARPFPTTAELQSLAPMSTPRPFPAPTVAPAPRRNGTAPRAPQPAPAPAPLTSAAKARSQHPSQPAPAPGALASTTTAVQSSMLQTGSGPLVAAFEEWLTERVAAHEAFLTFSNRAQELAARLVTGEIEVESGALAPAQRQARFDARTDLFVAPRQTAPTLPLPSSPPPRVPHSSSEPPRALDYDQCLEFAIGQIGNVLGPKFAEIDRFPTRVRLPDVPLMLVDRILAIEGEPLSMTRGRVVTEKDIHAGEWYLDCGRMPTCLAVESGQADLFLSGWLGIDLHTRGLAVYRLLDAVVTFHDGLPGPGKTIHYDIRINGFFRQGETYLFRFEFDATVDGQPLLTMRDGCAGFFTAEALAAGQGIIHTALDRQPQTGRRPDDWSDPVPMTVEAYSDAQLDALRQGDLAACFGPVFAALPLRQPVTLPAGRLRLVHRVLSLEPGAGKFGLGQIRGEADIHPDDWFLTCHFCDDQVMPGTLMYECCLHTLRVYLLRMGWIGETDQVVYEPVPGVKSKLKCRGQVLASTKKVWYEITLKEMGYGPGSPGIATPGSSPDDTPYCLADALMYADGKPIVEITDMSVRLTGLTRGDIQRLWAEAKGSHPLGSPGAIPHYDLRPALFDTARITAFAIGKPSDAFGDRYRVFDAERKIARLPGPPFQFLDRITSIEHCEPWKLQAGGVIEAQYDVPVDAWYFAANRQQRMPFAVLLETALQPCGWLAGYLGSALTSDIDLSFRNLGGKATQFEDVLPTSGTLTTTVKITRVSQSAGMIIQHFEFDLRCAGRPVYQGTTYFGFFSHAALANQVGIRDAAIYQPTAAELARAKSFEVPVTPPFPDEQFRMVRQVDALVPDGGPHGLGYIRGSVTVDPSRWFFQAHFYQDPVWPGSLGLESFLQLVKVYAAQRWCGDVGWAESSSPTKDVATNVVGLADSAHPTTQFAAVALHHPHEWVYRGQVIPRDKAVTVEVVVTAVDEASHTVTAAGFLIVDGRVIYQMIDFTVQAILS